MQSIHIKNYISWTELWNWEQFQNCLTFFDTPCMTYMQNMVKGKVVRFYWLLHHLTYMLDMLYWVIRFVIYMVMKYSIGNESLLYRMQVCSQPTVICPMGFVLSLYYYYKGQFVQIGNLYSSCVPVKIVHFAKPISLTSTN
jgi:hypothetical protein